MFRCYTEKIGTMKFLSMRFLFVAVSISLLSSCGTVAKKYAIAPEVTPLSVSAIVGVEKFADVGDSLFVKGVANKNKVLLLKNDISSTMPGAYHLPFDFSVKDSIDLNFEEIPYARTLNDLKELWRKRFKLSTLEYYSDLIEQQGFEKEIHSGVSAFRFRWQWYI